MTEALSTLGRKIAQDVERALSLFTLIRHEDFLSSASFLKPSGEFPESCSHQLSLSSLSAQLARSLRKSIRSRCKPGRSC